MEEFLTKFMANGELKFKQHFYFKCVRRGQIIETVPIREELGLDKYGNEKWKRPNTEVIKRGDIVVLDCHFKITHSSQGCCVSLLYNPNMILRIREMKKDLATKYCFVSPIIMDDHD